VKLNTLSIPIVQAPLAGGPSTPELTAAVVEAGAFGFLAGGYKTSSELAGDIAALRRLTDKPYGVNLFLPDDEADAATFADYLEQIGHVAEQHGVALGQARYDDDFFSAKLDIVLAERVPVVSFTFGCPDPALIGRVHDVGSEVWVTVTDPDEGAMAQAAGADVLVAQGLEAGGHRGCFVDGENREDYGLLALLQLLTARVDLPLVAAGGISTGAGVAAVLAAGASAAQLGTAFLRCSEAGTSAVHRTAMTRPSRTRLTRAFTGRLARGIENRFLVEHSAAAPIAYPQIHHATAPLRAAGRATEDATIVNLWAGQAYQLAAEVPAADVISALHRDLGNALAAATARVRDPIDG